MALLWNVRRGLLELVQVACLVTARVYYWRPFSRDQQRGLVVGTSEVANVLASLGKALPEATSVCLSPSAMYEAGYRVVVPPGHAFRIRQGVVGAWLLGRFLSMHCDFFFIWRDGFLINRKREMGLITASGGRIAWMFCGDDIRSPQLQRQLSEALGTDSFANYGWYADERHASATYEAEKRELANLADSHADVVFSAPNCQASYLDTNSGRFVAAHGFVALEENQFCESDEKFHRDLPIRIVHAPTSPEVKGTLLVRAAIAKLHEEGFAFEYRELRGANHETVRRELFEAHICLNQFLSIGSGVLGLEAMAARCVTLMSASPELDPSILPFDTAAWVVTPSWKIYDNLRNLLENATELPTIANEGCNYARRFYTVEAASNRLRAQLRDRGFSVAETYDEALKAGALPVGSPMRP